MASPPLGVVHMLVPPRVTALFALVLIAGVVCGLRSGRGAGATSSCGSVPDVVTHGPRVGAVTDTTALIWVRACQQAQVSVQYKLPSEDWSSAQMGSAALTDPALDNTAVVSLSGLSPSSEYDYRVIVESQQPSKPLAGTFRTLYAADTQAAFSFIITSDMHYPNAPLPTTMLNTMRGRDVDFAVLAGDQFVIEQVLNKLGRCCTPQSQADYELSYEGMYAQTAFRNFVADTPTVMMWDDHEILNDWSQGSVAPYPWARGAFDEYAGSANPPARTAGGIHFSLRAGEVGVYVLDTRSYRSPAQAPDGPDKTMLGAEQKQDLKDWLLTSNAKFKLVVSSVMWNDFAGHTFYGESWPVYLTERNEILDFIHDNQISGVVLTSGDEHWAGAFKLAPWGIYEIAPAPIGSVAINGPKPSGPQVLFRLSWVSVFGLFTVDTTACPATLTVQLVDAGNTPRYTLPLTEMDLGADYDLDTLPPCQEAKLGTDPYNPDTDADGCTDGQELGPSAQAGGQRNPINPWDYFNPSGDGLNRVDDILTVIQHYGLHAGDAGYDTKYDRTYLGPNMWNLGPPDGLISVSDILAIIRQFGHDCA